MVGMDAEKTLARQLGVQASLHTKMIGGKALHYLRAGSGPPLVLLHGATVGWGQWFPNIAFLSRNFSVYALDIPGAGRSEPLDFCTADLERDVVAVLADFLRQEGLIGATLVGHSWGGWLAARLAAQPELRVNRVVLVSPVGFSSEVPWRYRLLANRAIVHLLTRTVMRPTKKNMGHFLQSVLAMPSAVPEALAGTLSESVRAEPMRHPFFLIQRMSNFFSVRKEFVLDPHTTRVPCPTLVMVGTRDRLIGTLDPERVRSIFPDSRVEHLAGVGHVPALEQPAVFHELLSAFLD